MQEVTWRYLEDKQPLKGFPFWKIRATDFFKLYTTFKSSSPDTFIIERKSLYESCQCCRLNPDKCIPTAAFFFTEYVAQRLPNQLRPADVGDVTLQSVETSTRCLKQGSTADFQVVDDPWFNTHAQHLRQAKLITGQQLLWHDVFAILHFIVQEVTLKKLNNSFKQQQKHRETMARLTSEKSLESSLERNPEKTAKSNALGRGTNYSLKLFSM